MLKGYRSKKATIKKAQTLESIPVEGSLGLLAAGYKGIMLWRKKKALKKKQPLKNA